MSTNASASGGAPSSTAVGTTEVASGSAPPSTLRFTLNPHLDVHCPAPPVPIARAWADSYPSADSPYHPARRSPPSGATQPPSLLNLSQGVPGEAPPRAFLDKLASLSEEQPKFSAGYGPVFGEPELRRALVQDLRGVYGRGEGEGDDGGIRLDSDNVAITAGCNLAAAAVFQAIAAPGDAVVLPTPWYFNHQMTLHSLAVEPLPLPTSAPDFVPSVEGLARLLDDYDARREHGDAGRTRGGRVRAVVLVTPNNPTGAVYPRETLRAFADFCRGRGLALVLDETYRDFLLADDDERQTPAASRDGRARPHDLFLHDRLGWDWQESLISLHSFSKSYAIPGHRLGAIVCSPHLLISGAGQQQQQQQQVRFGALSKALDNLQICAPRMDAQRAVAWAVRDAAMRAWRLGTARELRERRRRFGELLRRRVRVEVAPPASPESSSSSSSSSSSAVGRVVEESAESMGWRVESLGGYYAFVRAPRALVYDAEADATAAERGIPLPHTHGGECGAEWIARRLAELVGVVLLPGSFFVPAPPPSSSSSSSSVPAGEGRDATSAAARQRLRVSLANVSTEALGALPERLVLGTHLLLEEKERRRRQQQQQQQQRQP